MAHLVECLLCVQEVVDSIPGSVILKILKIIPAALSFVTQHYAKRARKQNWLVQCQYNVAGWNITSCCLCLGAASL